MVVHYNLREQVLNAIGKRIIGGQLKPGDVLPKEDALSEQYEVSRTVIREAVKGLAARGLVESRPKVGTIIRPRSEWQMLDPAVLDWVATAEPETQFKLRLAEVRLTIEPATAELAARNATEEDIVAIEEAFHQLETAIGDEKAWSVADLAFHESMVAACHNEFLAYIVRALRKPLYSKRLINVSMVSIMKPDDVVDPYKSPEDEVLSRHWAVFDAIKRRDEIGARDASRDMLARVTDLMAKYGLDEELLA